ncbi:HD-GYP domain-containing protein [Acetomicrobium sp. S15 = DSM 107314]|uniref:HD-GYP domain-containing protein n=1 Tax=Acetomicrobium sp. S15 = DSM 107314 TaxID=2529858 RepID=UPI0018E10202|nr:HD-GYP domain-containing protein [Acetomicrobium sp. S15 = DSM 107314]
MEQPLSAQEIPVEDIATRDFVLAEDIVSAKKVLLLPKGVDLSWFGSAKKRLVQRLKSEGVTHIRVFVEKTPSARDLEELIQRIRGPVKQIDRALACQAVRQLGDVYRRIASDGMTEGLFEPLLSTGHILAQEILSSKAITLSLYKMRQWDEYTFVHSLNVALLSGFLASRLRPGDNVLVNKITTGILLHDLGKAKVPLHILNKPARLTDAEFAIIKTHPVKGFELALQQGIRDEEVLTVVRGHHERWNGNGYPDRLRGEAIPLPARIAAVADVFDALTTNRIYKEAESPKNAISIIVGDAGNHFDPGVVRELLLSLGLYPPGVTVELSDGSVGVVVSTFPGDLVRPTVMLFADFEGQEGSLRLVNLRESDLYIRRSIGSVDKRALDQEEPAVKGLAGSARKA